MPKFAKIGFYLTKPYSDLSASSGDFLFLPFTGLFSAAFVS